MTKKRSELMEPIPEPKKEEEAGESK